LSDPREQLRRYLEQRRELGETEFILDSLPIAEVLSLIGARGGGGSRPEKAVDTDWRAVLSRSEDPQSPTNPAKLPERAKAARAAKDAKAEQAENAEGPDDSVIAALPSIDAIAATVATCTRCPLHATALNPVPGEGNHSADFMVVGEAPGATEDETGRPFVGAAGQLLTRILAAVNLSRDDVFIANVLKHRPPGNRNPLPNEVAACSPYLLRQIELVRPKVILAVGTFAAQTLLGTKATIGQLRAQVHQFHGVPLVVTYHPAALLRNPNWRRPTWEDVQLARRVFDSVNGA
jgi:uracil-DNA glycosylase